MAGVNRLDGVTTVVDKLSYRLDDLESPLHLDPVAPRANPLTWLGVREIDSCCAHRARRRGVRWRSGADGR